VLALRLVRGAPPLVLARRLLVVCAAAGVAFLLLSSLSFAVAHPARSGDAVVRLLWCLAPLAASVQLAVAVARTETGRRALSGLDAAGLGPSRLPLLAAVSAALSCLLGSVLALLAFRHLRAAAFDGPLAGVASDLLDGDRALPSGAVLTLLCVAPLTAAGACAFALRPRAMREGAQPAPHAPGTTMPGGLPWGAALTAAGLAVEVFASREALAGSGPGLLPLPGTLEGNPPGVLLGWLLTVSGLVLAGPGLTHCAGRLLCAGRPGALRLLAGRVLQAEAARVGRQLGVLCAVGAGVLAALELYGTVPAGDGRVFGPLSVLGAALVVGCTAASASTAAAEVRAGRAEATAHLLRLGAPRSLLRGAAALRVVAVLVVLTPLTWAAGHLAALPLDRLGG
jgi:hypothetical protein